MPGKHIAARIFKTRKTYLDDSHWFGLPNAMTPIFCLQIIEGIKVQIMQDANIGCSQIDTCKSKVVILSQLYKH